MSREAACYLCHRSVSEGAVFTRDRSKPGGLSNKCRECQSEKSRRWYQANRVRVIARVRANKRRRREEWERRKWQICRHIIQAMARNMGTQTYQRRGGL